MFHFYTAVLPLLKKYVCLFQTKEPLIHKLYDEQEQLFLNFLSCFIKAEILKDKNIKQLLSLNVSNEDYILKKSMFLVSAESIVSKDLEHNAVASFLEQAKQAYVECAQYLQKKLPLDNYLLKCLSAIDPIARGHSLTADRLKAHPKLVTNMLTERLSIHLMFIYISWVSFRHHMQMNMEMYHMLMSGGLQFLHPINILLFLKWSRLLLSCFHGCKVESSFSIMEDMMDKQSGNMNIETFSAIQTVKYRLSSRNKLAIDFF